VTVRAADDIKRAVTRDLIAGGGTVVLIPLLQAHFAPMAKKNREDRKDDERQDGVGWQGGSVVVSDGCECGCEPLLPSFALPPGGISVALLIALAGILPLWRAAGGKPPCCQLSPAHYTTARTAHVTHTPLH